MTRDLTKGSVMGSMMRFAIPLIAGNLLQQCYNIADTWVVGKFLGSGALFSIRFGQRDEQGLIEDVHASFALIGALTVVLSVLAFVCLDSIRVLMQVPEQIWELMRQYLAVIFCGIAATFLYNYFASFLRAVGNSLVPLIFLAVSTVMNIGLDLWFVLGLERGVAGAAEATVISQYAAGIGIAVYALARCPELSLRGRRFTVRRGRVREIAGFSVLTCVQQSVMNLGILMVQGLVNSFGTAVMAAFAAAVKIDAFAYMPVQDFGNAFSTFIAQNYGAKNTDRIRRGLKGAIICAMVFCVIISAAIYFFASPLIRIFVDGAETQIIREGVRYLRVEGAFYCGIGCLFLLYGLYRALGRPGMSVVLTVLSLGTRVILAYVLSAVPALGVTGIWWSIPIGWFLADIAGIAYYILRKKHLFPR